MNNTQLKRKCENIVSNVDSLVDELIEEINTLEIELDLVKEQMLILKDELYDAVFELKQYQAKYPNL